MNPTTNSLKAATLELNATAFLVKHDINFDPDKEFTITPNHGQIYTKKLGDMTVRELLLSDGIYGNSLGQLIRLTRRMGHSQIIKIFSTLLRDLTD